MARQSRLSNETADETRTAENGGEQPPPPFYIATAPLFIGGSQFNRAHNVGDRVPVEHVDRYGWRERVRRPDDPQNEPETTPGQATTADGEGDA